MQLSFPLRVAVFINRIGVDPVDSESDCTGRAQVILVVHLYLNDFSFMYHDRGQVRANIEHQALSHTERLLHIAPS